MTAILWIAFLFYFILGLYIYFLNNLTFRLQYLLFCVAGIPYSEHSSYLEMKRFVQWLKPQKIIPTVNVGTLKSRRTMEKYFKEWKLEAGY